ncbi:MAG TPA: hypothetical protein VJP80_08530 [Candidatus Saccharimonadales bacterium]|nr:hypothetical protein [Candidatus Saccharimonadales bacterium]
MGATTQISNNKLLAAMQAGFTNIEVRLDALETEVAGVKSDVKRVQSDLQQVQSQMDHMQGDLRHVQFKLSEHDVLLSQLVRTTETFTHEREAYLNDLKDVLDRLVVLEGAA